MIGLGQISAQTSFEPATVMEFGFNEAPTFHSVTECDVGYTHFLQWWQRTVSLRSGPRPS